MPLRARLPSPPPRLWTAAKRMQLKKGPRQRPETATLEKPLVLDPGLLRKLDMTRLTRDRLSTIDNLLATPKKPRPSPRVKEKGRKKSVEGKSDSWEDEESSVVDDFKVRKPRVINTTFRVRSHVRKGLREVFSSPTQLQVPSVPTPEKEKTKAKGPKVKDPTKKSVEDVFGSLESCVPSPCKACGRSERPERLHAHPVTPHTKRTKLREDQENTRQKNSVMKPVAMKFRSGKARSEHQEVEKPKPTTPDKKQNQKEAKENKPSVPLIRRETFKIERPSKPTLVVGKKASSTPSPSPTRKSSLAGRPIPIPRRQALPRTPDRTPRASLVPPASPLVVPAPANPPVVHSASPRRPRTITCYLCHKQFGTASYPLHEPQCLQKWHRENQALPAAQQLPQPQKPAEDPQATWDYAWEAAQAAMVTCDGCSKTFLPHRLEAHQRVCPHYSPFKKAAPAVPKQLQTGWESDRSERSVVLEGPTSVHCHICGRVFNKAAIEKHEQQCLKRWQLEHSRESGSSAPPSNSSSPPSSAQSTPRRRLVLCYLCSRQFGSASIAIHEPQCLRKWHQENDRLPAAQRRQEPQKPDVVYDAETGRVDYQATGDAQWQSHIVQLVPCAKCGRTFNPDRVIVHEKCCKGPQKH